MDLIDKILIAFSAASWVLYFLTRKNLAFGVAVGVTIFSLIAIALDL